MNWRNYKEKNLIMKGLMVTLPGGTGCKFYKQGVKDEPGGIKNLI